VFLDRAPLAHLPFIHPLKGVAFRQKILLKNSATNRTSSIVGDATNQSWRIARSLAKLLSLPVVGWWNER
jgi:hypothetical protein